MSLILSGTDGVSDVDGTAATPALRGSDTNTGIFFPAADTIAFAEGGVESARLDSAGNLGIGTSSPIYRLEALVGAGSANIVRFGQSGVSNGYTIVSNGTNLTHTWDVAGSSMVLNTAGNLGLGVTPSAWQVAAGRRAIEVGSAGNGLYGFSASNFNMSSGAYYDGAWRYAASGTPVSYYNQAIGAHTWFTAPSGTAGNAISFTQAMTLDSSGNLLVGTTSRTAAGINTFSTLQVNNEIMSRGSQGGIFWENRAGGVGTNANWYGWYAPNGTQTFFWNGSANAASINNSTGGYTPLSDRNKKKDFEPSPVGLSEVMRLKPTLFRMLDDAADAPKHLGFIAQDVADVIPQAYVEASVIDAGGNQSTYIGLNDRPIIAALTAAIQEQQAMIKNLQDAAYAQMEMLNQLTTRIAALEAK